ncbi:BCCT family transporter [Schaalia vaccimaxillae]|uniref:BCCT family transporter n=1 Tax=Schaalia vaccimaxillae TaxID=183916 RepID=UPI0003B7B004|nr:BCCT family transporter [Schaalia vaccimaxillae]
MSVEAGSDSTRGSQTKMGISPAVFGIPWLLLATIAVVALVSGEVFLRGLNLSTSFILGNFAWLFNWTALACLIVVIFAYFSPFGRLRIGGSRARAKISFRSLIWIVLCTMIAAGLLFWAAAEPIYHLSTPALSSRAVPGSPEAILFAMRTMFLEWTWAPFAIYTAFSLICAYVFFNLGERISVGSILVPLFGPNVQRVSRIVDIVCLFSLGAGMAASLGTGTITIAGGISSQFDIPSSPLLWGIIIFLIVLIFVFSSITGVMKGIRLLSSFNSKIFFGILVFFALFGPTVYSLSIGTERFGSYLSNFFFDILNTGTAFEDGWNQSWPVFYWCNWLAWTPVTATFIASISRGFTMRQLISAGLIVPSVFSMLWITLVSGASIYYETQGVDISGYMAANGPESAIYIIFQQLPFSRVVIPIYLFIVFISLVTASDSNTTAVAEISTRGTSLMEDKKNMPALFVKIIWGVTIGLVAWLVISYGGVEGIKAASNLGGFPSMFLVILGLISLVVVMSRIGGRSSKNLETVDPAGFW